MKRQFLLLLTVLFAFALVPTRAQIKLNRGINISHWLSQSDVRGTERANFFTEKDVAYLASIGFDHLRLPIDEEQMFTADGEKDAEAFALLHQALKWCRKYKLKAVVDMHILRSHYFNAAERPLFTQTAAQEAFYDCWRKVSDELKGYSTKWVAYELMNEPVADNPEDWNKVANRCAQVLRELEPKRTLIIGSNRWQAYDTVKDLRIPEGDKYIIISFHYYNPFPFTHHQASWTDIKDYRGKVHYPGQLVTKADLQEVPDEIAKKFHWMTDLVWNREVIAEHFEQVMEYARKHQVGVYCGEYGCIDQTPAEDRDRWLTDMNQVFEEKGIARALWDYKGGFGIIKNGIPNQKMIQILSKKYKK